MIKSEMVYKEALEYIPGGVNSPVRAFKAVGGTPPVIDRGSGSRIWDIDGNEYIDYVCSWGPLILGHAPACITKILEDTIKKGTSFGAPTIKELELAKLIVNAVPSIEKVRLVNSGTEAAMSAIRLARGFTGRSKIIKFEGCYHGHADSMLVKGGSGLMTFGIPDSLGIPSELARLTITLPFNDIDSVRNVMDAEKENIACVIVEPIAGNMGVIPPKAGFLEGLRKLTEKYRALLIFDEVITGFRVAYGGAQELYKINPDITCLGKVIGGGLPIGAYGGKKEIMDMVAPAGGVYQAGTLSGNPLAVAAGIEVLNQLSNETVYKELLYKSSKLRDGIIEVFKNEKSPITINSVGSMMTIFFTGNDVFDYQSAKTSDTKRYNNFFHSMLKRGINLAPSQFEAAFISTAHTEDDINFTINAAKESLYDTNK